MINSSLTVGRIAPLVSLALLAATASAAALLMPTVPPLLVAMALIVLAGVALALLRFKDLAYWGLIAVLPLEATFVIEAGFSILPAYLLLAMQIGLLALLRERIEFERFPTKLLSGYLAIVVLSLLYAYVVTPPLVDTTGAMTTRASALRPAVQTGLIALYIVFFAIVLQRNRTASAIRNSLQVYLGIAAMLAVLGCWQSLAVTLDLPGKDFTQAFGAISGEQYRYGETRFYSALITGFAPRTTFRESLHFSHYLISVVPLALTLLFYRKRLPEAWRLKFLPALVIFGSAALFLTMSRSGWIAMLSALAFVAFFAPKRQVLKYVAGCVGALLLLGGVLTSLGYFRLDLGLWELIALRLDAGVMESDPRVMYLNVLWSTFRDYPLLGVGIGNYGAFGAAAVGIPTLLSAHSIFLNALVETGILGFLALGGLILHFFVKLVRAIRSSRDLALYPYLVGVGAGVFGMTLQYFTFGDRPSFYYLFLLAIGYALVYLASENSVASSSESV